MDFGDLIFFLIFIIIIITNILGQMKKSRRPPADAGDAGEERFESRTRTEPDETPSSDRTGWRQTLDNILTDVREQARARSESGPEPEHIPRRQPSGWDILMGGAGRDRDPGTAERPRPDPETRAGEAALKREKKVSSAPDAGVTRTTHYTPASRQRPERTVYTPSRRRQPERTVYTPKRRRQPERTIYTPAYWSEEQRKTAAVKYRTDPARRRMPLQDLKNAIIWHEIFSRPVGLRDEQSGKFGGY
jgi:hypothetical protein